MGVAFFGSFDNYLYFHLSFGTAKAICCLALYPSNFGFNFFKIEVRLVVWQDFSLVGLQHYRTIDLTYPRQRPQDHRHQQMDVPGHVMCVRVYPLRAADVAA